MNTKYIFLLLFSFLMVITTSCEKDGNNELVFEIVPPVDVDEPEEEEYDIDTVDLEKLKADSERDTAIWRINWRAVGGLDLREEGYEEGNPSIVVSSKFLLPSLIIKRSDSFTNQNVDSILYEYDKENRPIRITQNKWATSFGIRSKTSIVSEIDYKDADNIVQWDYYDGGLKGKYTYQKQGDVVNITCEVQPLGNLDMASYSLSNDLTYNYTKLSVDSEYEIIQSNRTYEYYSNKDIKQIVGIRSWGAREVYQYDNYNGIFKSVNLPHWVKVILYDDINITLGHSNNNSKNSHLIYSSDPAGTNSLFRLWKYRYNQDGFPIIKCSRYAPPRWSDGISLFINIEYIPINI